MMHGRKNIKVQLMFTFFINHAPILDRLITFSKYDTLFHQKLGHGIVNLAFYIIRALHFELVIPEAYSEATNSTSQVLTLGKKDLFRQINFFVLKKSDIFKMSFVCVCVCVCTRA